MPSPMSDLTMVVVAFVTEFVTDPQLDGEDAGWPTVMGRLAWSMLSPCDCERAEFGISGHIGQEGIDFDPERSGSISGVAVRGI